MNVWFTQANAPPLLGPTRFWNTRSWGANEVPSPKSIASHLKFVRMPMLNVTVIGPGPVTGEIAIIAAGEAEKGGREWRTGVHAMFEQLCGLHASATAGLGSVHRASATGMTLLSTQVTVRVLCPLPHGNEHAPKPPAIHE